MKLALAAAAVQAVSETVADTGPRVPVGQASPQQKGRRRSAMRWIVHSVMVVALAAGVFGLLPRLGGLTRDAAGLRYARPAFVAAAIVAQAASLGCYALLYRRVLASLGARLPFRLAAQVTLATFLVSHVTPFGSATGTLLNVSTLETEGVAASTTGEAIGLTSLVSMIALIALFGTGFVTTAGRHLSRGYLTIAGIALVLVVSVLAIALLVGVPSRHRRAGGAPLASGARHVRSSIDPEKVAQTSKAARVAGAVSADRQRTSPAPSLSRVVGWA